MNIRLNVALAALLACGATLAQVPDEAVPGEPPGVPNPAGCRGLFAGFKVVDMQQQGCVFSEILDDKGTSVWTCPTRIMVLCPLEAFGKFASEGQ